MALPSPGGAARRGKCAPATRGVGLRYWTVTFLAAEVGRDV